MDSVFYFITSNYLIIIIIVLAILMAIVGYYAEKTNFGKNKYNTSNDINNIDKKNIQELANKKWSDSFDNKSLLKNDLQVEDKENSIEIKNENIVKKDSSNLSTKKENVESKENDELEDLDIAFEKAFQDQISISDVDNLDDDIDNMKVEPLFSSDGLSSNIINIDSNSNIELPKIKKIDTEEEKKDVWSS